MTDWAAMKRAVQMAVNWVKKMVGGVTVCWAVKMVVTRVDFKAG